MQHTSNARALFTIRAYHWRADYCMQYIQMHLCYISAGCENRNTAYDIGRYSNNNNFYERLARRRRMILSPISSPSMAEFAASA